MRGSKLTAILFFMVFCVAGLGGGAGPGRTTLAHESRQILANFRVPTP